MIGARLGLALSLLASACSGAGEDSKPDATAQAPAPEPEAAPPTDGRAFLRELAPLPGSAPDARELAGLRLRYLIRGPAGSDGSLVIELAPGGVRREDWTLRLPAMGDAPERLVRSQRVQNHEWVWSALGETAGEKYPSPLASLAEAYDARSPAARASVTRHLRAWQKQLREARGAQPGERDEIQGVSCLRMNMAGQALCIWEETGLPLRHQSEAFSLEIEKIERGVEFEAGIFELPPAAQGAALVDPPEAWSAQGEAWLTELERGDPAALATVLTPGLRLPSSAEITKPDAG